MIGVWLGEGGDIDEGFEIFNMEGIEDEQIDGIFVGSIGG